MAQLKEQKEKTLKPQDVARNDFYDAIEALVIEDYEAVEKTAEGFIFSGKKRFTPLSFPFWNGDQRMFQLQNVLFGLNKFVLLRVVRLDRRYRQLKHL